MGNRRGTEQNELDSEGAPAFRPLKKNYYSEGRPKRRGVHVGKCNCKETFAGGHGEMRWVREREREREREK